MVANIQEWFHCEIAHKCAVTNVCHNAVEYYFSFFVSRFNNLDLLPFRCKEGFEDSGIQGWIRSLSVTFWEMILITNKDIKSTFSLVEEKACPVRA